MITAFPSVEHFNLKPVTIAGEECILVTPKNAISMTWTEENKIFRSSIWTKEGKLVSPGYKKFVNLSESPSFEPIDNYSDLKFVTKVDGSLLIISQYKGELIARTRGTVDASLLPNGFEIPLLKEKYPEVFNNGFIAEEDHTILCEWTTPTNRIVISETPEPTLHLIGMIRHTDYSYVSQSQLDILAKTFKVSRPKTWDVTLLSIQEYLKDAESIEGVVIYANNDQYLKKVKSTAYLFKHRIFTGIKTAGHVFEIFVEYGCPKRLTFEMMLAQKFDHELVASIKSFLDTMYEKWDTNYAAYLFIKSQVTHPSFSSLSRAEQARKILSTEQLKGWSDIAFGALDNKPVDPAKLYCR